MDYEWQNGDDGADTEFVAPWFIVERLGKYYVQSTCNKIVGGPYSLNVARLISQAPNLLKALDAVIPANLCDISPQSIYASKILQLVKPENIGDTTEDIINSIKKFSLEDPNIGELIVELQRKIKP